VCDWGFRVYRQEYSACRGDAFGPDAAHREHSTCARRKNFVISRAHRPYRLEQACRYEALLKKPALPTQTLKIARECLGEALSSRGLAHPASSGAPGKLKPRHQSSRRQSSLSRQPHIRAVQVRAQKTSSYALCMTAVVSTLPLILSRSRAGSQIQIAVRLPNQLRNQPNHRGTMASQRMAISRARTNRLRISPKPGRRFTARRASVSRMPGQSWRELRYGGDCVSFWCSGQRSLRLTA